jgi:hypothetical protein
MEVFNIKSGTVELIEQSPFKLEREIQDVIEKNTEYPKLFIQRNVILWRNFEDIITFSIFYYQSKKSLPDASKTIVIPTGLIILKHKKE